MEEYDIYDVFDIKARDEHPAQLGSFFNCNVELTINIKQDKMTMIEHIDVYKELFENLKAEYNATAGAYEIEYCKSGQLHIHGWMDINLHINVYQYDTSEILRMIAKSIFIKLPKKYYKQYAKADVNETIKRFKSPAVVLNLKNLLSRQWVEYIEKNASKL